MRRKKSNNRNGRLANVDEKKFQRWLKEQPCVWCDNPGPSIVDHCRGSTFKHLKVLIGHFFCLPHCVECDTKKTIYGKRLGNEAEAWLKMDKKFSIESTCSASDDVFCSIRDWNK